MLTLNYRRIAYHADGSIVSNRVIKGEFINATHALNLLKLWEMPPSNVRVGYAYSLTTAEADDSVDHTNNMTHLSRYSYAG